MGARRNNPIIRAKKAAAAQQAAVRKAAKPLAKAIGGNNPALVKAAQDRIVADQQKS